MRILTIIILSVLVLSVGNVANASQIRERTGTCKNLKEKLELCENFKCKAPYANFSSFIVSHEIKGPLPDGKCYYSQTMPAGGLSECTVDERTRMVIARMWKEYLVTGRESTSRSDQEVLNVAYKNDDCIITGY